MTDRLNLIETIAKEPKFSTFSRYMGSSNAKAFFSRPGDFTVLVPALAGAQNLTSTVTAGASTPPIPVAGVSPIASAAPANQVPTAGSMAVTQKIPQATTPLTLLTAKTAKPAKPIF